VSDKLASLGRAIDPTYYLRQAVTLSGGDGGSGEGSDRRVGSGAIRDIYDNVSISDRIKRIYENWTKVGVPIGEGKNYRSIGIDRLSEEIQSRILTSTAQALLAHASPLGAVAAELLQD
jgi:hypothetical protein